MTELGYDDLRQDGINALRAEIVGLREALEELANYMEAEHGPGQPGSMLHRARAALNSVSAPIVKSSQPIDVIGA